MATIRRRKRGVWEVRVFAGRDGNGKPVQISRTVYGGKKDAERVANELARKPAKTAGRRTVEMTPFAGLLTDAERHAALAAADAFDVMEQAS